MPAHNLSPIPPFNDTSIAFGDRTNAEIRRSWWLFKLVGYPKLVNFGTPFLQMALKLKLPVSWLIKATIFKQFVGGENIADCKEAMARLHKHKIGAILDYSVEGEKNEAAFDATLKETLATIDAAALAPDIIPFAVFKLTGLGAFDLLAKVQAAENLSEIEKTAFAKVENRVFQICNKAYINKVKVFFDGEETWINNVIDSLSYKMMAQFNKEQAIIFNTYQLYRKDSLSNLKAAFEEARLGGFWLGAKLVRGAYMENERAMAAKMNWPDPIQTNKQNTDQDYNAALAFCLDNLSGIAFCAGTHNEASSLWLAQEMDRREIARNNKRIWFSQLYGMSDNISFNLASAGFNVCKYLPYGPLESVMPYLIRRAKENTSVAGQSSRELVLLENELNRRKD